MLEMESSVPILCLNSGCGELEGDASALGLQISYDRMIPVQLYLSSFNTLRWIETVLQVRTRHRNCWVRVPGYQGTRVPGYPSTPVLGLATWVPCTQIRGYPVPGYLDTGDRGATFCVSRGKKTLLVTPVPRYQGALVDEYSGTREADYPGYFGDKVPG